MENFNYTYIEITTQINSMIKVYDDIINKKFNLDFNISNDYYDEIILFGCGTSYNLSQSAAFFTKFLLNGKSCFAIPSSELLINTDTYINKEKKYLAIGFSRSGETSESINIVKKFKEKNNIKSLIFTCKKDSTITSFADNYFTCRDAAEKSIVMTVSFTSMLFAYCLLLAKSLSYEKMLNEFKYLIGYLDEKITDLFNDIESYLEINRFSSYFVLGSGFNYGLATEADLKMKEMCQIPSYSYYLHEFNHGPKSLVTKESLCLILTLNTNLFKNEVIINEILNLESKVLLIGSKPLGISETKLIKCLLFDSNFKFDVIKSFINIPVFQILAYVSTIKKNLNPDKPKNLSYTVMV